MNPIHKISIIIPCRNEEAHIEEAVSSVLVGLEDTSAEILVCDGASTDGTRNQVLAMATRDARVHLVENPARHTPHGMNAGLALATGDHIFVVSAHATYPPKYFQRLSEALDRLGAACTGGVLRVEVKSDTTVARSIRAVLGDPFGVGNAYYRTGGSGEREVDTVAFGCYPRWVFDHFGTYNELLLRNQDIELNKRIIARGGKIWLVPEVEVIYFARTDLGAFLSNQFQNGRWNILTVAVTRSITSISFRHIVPAIFVLSIFLPILVGLLYPFFAGIALLPMIAYMPFAVWRALLLKRQGAQPGMTLAVFFLLHTAYGLGNLLGALQAPFFRGRLPRRHELLFRHRFEKRIFDFTLSLILLALFGWLILLCWVAASIDTRSNGIFTQSRIGRWGDKFTIYKIKTMRPIPNLTTTVTAENDVRITPLGRWLRKAKIDELPQLFNVLIGDMSFVGPRPDVPGFADKLDGEDRRILCLRPGITGPATLAFRNEEEILAELSDPDLYNKNVIYPAKVALNLNYLTNYMFKTDIMCMITTLTDIGKDPTKAHIKPAQSSNFR